MNSAKFSGMPAIGAWDLRTVIFAFLVLPVFCVSVFCQTRQQSPVQQSELARQNMARVAASSTQLIAILHRDPGLMVELKRWVAKDATDHGQLIADPDLTDEAIFDRLETDTTFRAVTTLLVQKYGYLQPEVNPESRLAKEQKFVTRASIPSAHLSPALISPGSNCRVSLG